MVANLLVLLASVAIFSIRPGTCLSCYRCETLKGGDCGEYFEMERFYEDTCDRAFTHCYESAINRNGQPYIVRGCGNQYTCSGKLAKECVICKGDLCNNRMFPIIK